MTRVLITNDDGIDAPGLRALAGAAVEAGYDVVVAAPAEEASGASAALSAYTDDDGKLLITRRNLSGLDGVPAYGVAASPAYIVVLATLDAFGPAPDVVLSGINRGANAGRAVLHSGTVGAAFTAAAYGMPALAASLDVLSPLDPTRGGNALAVLDETSDESRNWATAAQYVAEVLPRLDGLTDGAVLNLNVPDRPAEEIAGLAEAKLAGFGQVQMAVAESGEDFLRTSVQENRTRAEDGTDLALLTAGHATLTTLRGLLEL
ncbi:Survival protein SurE [Kribbella flavida DSM 17836]|uniref:5'-nucleotidase n=1 Tax=Kribbella flavida (strain DSM 17836 / JCM 10339 / NBRC 14399) TaxID=479435 RepID=D2Q2X9_KRIFD|nr:5'/3'-nucleotidase SurE [Kribbella flavida]ADB30310.1 Survival protein SurE [Kribbella flavida DSM 17836]